ncbi:ferredoxin reductase family protein [Bifidobacterium parmae]|uniref:FAD-binding FR-type domain-containing protein n=1 Tax=Bifidobacterium parmae TaxID=361854 RepID=A0A2N5J5S9_9BIFI|nr:ferredoxin reductase family protein [Bifidobacterium parmae]PLS29574.1 hypothetical protein Uis4E_0450 [Bifidobacterium parmae]
MLRRITTSTALTWVVALFVIPLPFLAALRAGLPSFYADMAAGIGIGVVAYVWMLAAVYLAGRPRWVDRTVGLPHMTMIHGVLSLLAIALAFLHANLLPAEGLTKLFGGAGLYLFVFLAVYSLVFMAGWLSARVRWVASLKRALERVFRHEASVWIHRLNLVAVALIFLHVQSIAFIRDDLPFIILFDAATAAVFVWYVASKIRQRAGAVVARVADVRQIAPGVTELTLDVPAKDARWEPGDFTFIRFPETKGMREYHPFSMINTSSAAPTRRGFVPMRFDIRADGDFTRRIAALPVGAVTHVQPSYGRYRRFIDEHAAGAPLVMFGGGIGVTPLLSLIEAYAPTGRSVTLLYGARGERDLVHADDLRAMDRDHANVHVTLRAGGRFEERDVADAMRPGALYLIAGPYGMLKAWRTFLLKRGVAADDIYYEPFAM